MDLDSRCLAKNHPPIMFISLALGLTTLGYKNKHPITALEANMEAVKIYANPLDLAPMIATWNLTVLPLSLAVRNELTKIQSSFQDLEVCIKCGFVAYESQ